ncbi:hypothetical protein GOD00_23345 [Sinorhizobium medicae]|nr:hypothetical protein [Sinorhizobium medicae]
MPDKTMMLPVGAATEPAALVATNPFEALLPEDRLSQLSQMPPEKKREYYGRVVESVFSDPVYQKLVFEVASREFDRMTQPSTISESDLRSVVEEVVTNILKARPR